MDVQIAVDGLHGFCMEVEVFWVLSFQMKDDRWNVD